MKLFFIFLFGVFVLVGCAADKSEQTNNEIEGTDKPQNEQAQERAEKLKAQQERLYLQFNSVEMISIDDNSVSLRISYRLNNNTQFTAFSIPVKKGQLVFQDMSNWLGTIEQREKTRVEFVLQRQDSSNELQTLFLAIQLRKPSRDKEKVSQNLVVLNYLENSNSTLVRIVKQKFEYPAKTEFRKWINENL